MYHNFNIKHIIIKLWTPHFDLISMRFPLDGELDFYLKKIDFIYSKMTWSRHLFLFYF